VFLALEGGTLAFRYKRRALGGLKSIWRVPKSLAGSAGTFSPARDPFLVQKWCDSTTFSAAVQPNRKLFGQSL